MIRKKIILILTLILFFQLTHFSAAASGENPKKDEAVDSAKSAQFFKEKMKLFAELSKYSSTFMPDSEVYYSYLAFELSKEFDSLSGAGIHMFSIGTLQMQRDSLLPALDYLLEAEEDLEQCDCDSLKASVFFTIGSIYFLHDNYYEALNYFIKSLVLSEKNNFNNMRFDTYTMLAYMYNRMENSDDAEYYYLKLFELCDTTVYNKRTILGFYNIGSFYKNRNKYDQANQYFKKAIAIAYQMRYYQNLPLLYLEIGNMEFNKGSYDEAFKHYKLAEASIDKIDSANIFVRNFWKTNTAYYIGRYYFAKGDYHKSLEIFTKVYQVALDKKLIMLKSLSSKFIGVIYERLGKSDRAIHYYKVFYRLHDSIINSRNLARVTKLEMDYRYMKDMNQKRLKHLKMEQQYKNKIQTYYWHIIIGVLSFIILILAFIIYRGKQIVTAKSEKLKQEKLKAEKGLLQKELDYKNKELTTSMMYLLKNNNFISELSKKMNAAVVKLKPEHKKPFRDIIKEMDSGLRNNAWEDFEVRFNNVHHNFNEKLLKDFPELTPNELKLCAFLKLNMTSKDIATITFQTINSITVARHRLRTKMGIDRDENLVVFLAKY
jgi:tetratricopeptide (TPR) repeat protein